MSEILTRLQGYNPPDRATTKHEAIIARDILEIATLRAENALLKEELRQAHETGTFTRDALRARVAALEEELEKLRGAGPIVAAMWEAEHNRFVKERNAALARVASLEKALEDAPHDGQCATRQKRAWEREEKPCDCWKAAAKEPYSARGSEGQEGR